MAAILGSHFNEAAGISAWSLAGKKAATDS